MATCAFDVVDHDVDLVDVLFRYKGSAVIVWTPRGPEYGRHPVVDIVAGTGAKEPVGESVHHLLTDTFRTAPPLLIGYPHRQCCRPVRDDPPGGNRNLDSRFPEGAVHARTQADYLSLLPTARPSPPPS